MKTKKRFQICLMLAIGIMSFLASSCKKDKPIVKIDPVITWSNPADITVGAILSATQLNATADVAGEFVYTPPIGTSLSVGANQDLRVDFTPSDVSAYNVVPKTVKINVVTKKDPVITWSNPADIAAGTMLSATQLNATADVEGTYVYTPPIGTSLSVGANQNLKVDFTPSDAMNYNTASKTVVINVVASTVTDFDGNVYNTVTIGQQVWMAENLRTTHYANGTAIPLVNTVSSWDVLTATSKAYCWYNDDIANKATYGALYTWAAAMNESVSTTNNPSGIQGVCPTGWHLPSSAELAQLENYLENNGYNYDGTTGEGSSKIGKAMASTSLWVGSSSTGAVGNTDYPSSRNKSGFTALPSGFRTSGGGFSGMGTYGYWWSATESNSNSAYSRNLYYDYGNVYSYFYDKDIGVSVRCVRN